MTISTFLGACWIIFLLYWLISAGMVKPIRRTSGWLQGNWYTLLFMLGYLLMTSFSSFGRLGLPLAPLAVLIIPHSGVVTALTVILMLSGLIIAIAARRTLAGNWSSQVAIKEGHELVTTGLYHYVRNPIYSGMLLMALASALYFSTLGALIGFLIIVLGMYLKLNDEERILTEHFGSQYTSYKQHSKALIPFLW